MGKSITICAGIDTGKYKLDIAIDCTDDPLQVENTAEGHQALVKWLKDREVTRVGIEASGGYERAVVALLRSKSFEVIVFQPAQVRAYAKFRQQRAKNDKIDARLIAACTAAVDTVHAAPDPRLAPLAEHLTMIDQIGEDIARFKNRLETCGNKRHRAVWMAYIARLTRQLKSEREALVKAIRRHPDLATRLDLILSVDGVGLPTAVAVLVRMPEIGQLSREQAAALAGLAPYDDDSGNRVGVRRIDGGRERLRRALYLAALPAAMHWNQQLIAFYKRLTAAGKQHKRALVACARKLLVFINTVVARGIPWQKKQPVRAAEPAAA
jgi:transposase